MASILCTCPSHSVLPQHLIFSTPCKPLPSYFFLCPRLYLIHCMLFRPLAIMQPFGLLLLSLLFPQASPAPTWPLSRLSPLSVINTWYAQLQDIICDESAIESCANQDGYLFRYNVFDPVDQQCVCSTSPSAYLVRVCSHTLV
jgi:hypothetical protein